MTEGGVTAKERSATSLGVLDEGDIELPDILTELQDKTQLTRKSLAVILTRSGRLDDFARNPQQFVEQAVEAILKTKQLALVDGIRYQRLGGQEFYAQELFESVELTAYLNCVAATKSVHDHVVYDSEVERAFAEQLESNSAVTVYAKLPSWFQVATPLGSYNPDWAVLVRHDGGERLYFVVETKGSAFAIDLRGKEQAKIECGKAHFAALGEGLDAAKFVVATAFAEVLAHTG